MIATGIGGLVSIEQQHSRLLEQGMRGITPFFVPGAISNIAAAKIYAEVVGYATNSDAYHVTAPSWD